MLSALAPHGKAVVVVGAQAVYLRTYDANLAVAPYTTDGDLVIDPSVLGDESLLGEAMAHAHFTRLTRSQGHDEPVIWVKTAYVNGEAIHIPVDLIVPQAVTPPGGRRGARLGVHGNSAARISPGLEAALIDHSPMVIGSLEDSDPRSFDVEVAGTSALLVAKAHKIHDRLLTGHEDRLNDKDASDIFRLMQTSDADEVGATLFELLTTVVAGETTRTAVEYLTQLFGRRGQAGIQMAGRALQIVVDPETVEVICTRYVEALNRRISQGNA